MSKADAKRLIEERLQGTIYEGYGTIADAAYLGADEGYGTEQAIGFLLKVIEELLK